jgi:hypothetical protein
VHHKTIAAMLDPKTNWISNFAPREEMVSAPILQARMFTESNRSTFRISVWRRLDYETRAAITDVTGK